MIFINLAGMAARGKCGAGGWRGQGCKALALEGGGLGGGDAANSKFVAYPPSLPPPHIARRRKEKDGGEGKGRRSEHLVFRAETLRAQIDKLAHAGGRSGLLFALFDGGRQKVGDRFALFVSGLEHGHLHQGLNLRLGGDDGGCGEGGHWQPSVESDWWSLSRGS